MVVHTIVRCADIKLVVQIQIHTNTASTQCCMQKNPKLQYCFIIFALCIQMAVFRTRRTKIWPAWIFTLIIKQQNAFLHGSLQIEDFNWKHIYVVRSWSVSMASTCTTIQMLSCGLVLCHLGIDRWCLHWIRLSVVYQYTFFIGKFENFNL